MKGARSALIAGALAALMCATPAGFADGSCGSGGRDRGDRGGHGGSWGNGGFRIVIGGGDHRDRRDRDRDHRDRDDDCDEVQTLRVCQRMRIDGKDFEAVVTLRREDGYVKANVRLVSLDDCSLPKIDSIRMRVRGRSSAWSPDMCRRSSCEEKDSVTFVSEDSVRWSSRQIKGLRIDLTVEGECGDDDRATWRNVQLN